MFRIVIKQLLSLLKIYLTGSYSSGYDSSAHPDFLREDQINEYIDIIELSGTNFKHKKEINKIIRRFPVHINWNIDK